MAGKGILHFDGASKGNPGKAGAGAVLMTEDGRVVSRIHEGLGVATNNVAEYRGLTLGLKQAIDHGFKSIKVYGDSQLVCKQVNDVWQTRNKNMKELCKEVRQLKQNFNSFEIKHVPREWNAEADRQANIGITVESGAVYEEYDDEDIAGGAVYDDEDIAGGAVYEEYDDEDIAGGAVCVEYDDEEYDDI